MGSVVAFQMAILYPIGYRKLYFVVLYVYFITRSCQSSFYGLPHFMKPFLEALWVFIYVIALMMSLMQLCESCAKPRCFSNYEVRMDFLPLKNEKHPPIRKSYFNPKNPWHPDFSAFVLKLWYLHWKNCDFAWNTENAFIAFSSQNYHQHWFILL